MTFALLHHHPSGALRGGPPPDDCHRRKSLPVHMPQVTNDTRCVCGIQSPNPGRSEVPDR
jgi:hypothetical protein